MARRETHTGGRDATRGLIYGDICLCVGKPDTPTPEGFQWMHLSDVARLESGHTPARSHPEYWDGDIPWIGIRDATGNHGRRINDTEQHVTQLGIDNSSARVLPADTVCLSRTASVGYVVTMGASMATSQDFVNWVCGPSLNHRYLHYALMLEQRAIRERFAHGSTHQTMYYPEAKALHLLAPDRTEQDAIAEVLGALDDKIAANERVRRLADQLRRTTFGAGFVEPCDETPLSATARFVNGRNFTKDASGTGRPVIRIAELNSGLGASTVYSDIEPAEDHVARAGDLLFAWSGSLTLRRWYLADGVVNQHIFKVLPSEGWPLWLVASLLERKLDDFKAIASDRATTMGHIQRRHLDEVVPVPPTAWLDRHGPELDGLWSAALAMEVESQKLAQLRDTLLPELMSGRMRVKDAESTVEGVL